MSTTAGIIQPILTIRTRVKLDGSVNEEYNTHAYNIATTQISSFVVDYVNDVVNITIDAMMPTLQCNDFEGIVRMIVKNLNKVELYFISGDKDGWFSPQHITYGGKVTKHQLVRGPCDDRPILQHEIVFSFSKMSIINRRETILEAEY